MAGHSRERKGVSHSNIYTQEYFTGVLKNMHFAFQGKEEWEKQQL